MWCSAADTHLKLRDNAASGRFLTGGVLLFDISQLRSVAVLCMLYNIRRNPMNPLNSALPGPDAQVLVTRRYTYAPPRCRTSQYFKTFIPLSVSLWNDLSDPVFDGVGLAAFKSQANAFFICLSCSIPTIVFFYFSLSLSVHWFVLWGWGLWTDRVYITVCQPFTAYLF